MTTRNGTQELDNYRLSEAGDTRWNSLREGKSGR